MDWAELSLKWRTDSGAAFQDSCDSPPLLRLVTLCDKSSISLTPGILSLFSICFAVVCVFF